MVLKTFYRAAMEKQRIIGLWTSGEKRVRCTERVTWKLTSPNEKRQAPGTCCVARETQTGALYQPRGVGWGGRWEGGSKGRESMYTDGRFMLRFDRKQQHSV